MKYQIGGSSNECTITDECCDKLKKIKGMAIDE